MKLTEKFNKALSYAEKLHREQKRKGTNIPYISHLMIVSAIVLEYGGTEEEAIAALLHDAIEDQGGETTFKNIRSQFGKNIASIVLECSDTWESPKPPWLARKEHFIKSLKEKNSSSLLVSLADKTHNAEAILSDYLDVGEEVWLRFNGGKEGTLWYYSELSISFNKLLNGKLSQRLNKVVEKLISLG